MIDWPGDWTVLWTEDSSFDSRQRQEIFLFSWMSRPALGSAQFPAHWILWRSYLRVKWPAPDGDGICLVPRASVGGAALHCTICLHGAGSTNPTTCDDASKHCIPCDVNPVMCSSLFFMLLPRGIRHIPVEASIMPVVLHVLPIRNLVCGRECQKDVIWKS